MKSVTAAYKEAQARPHARHVYEVYYKRRIWDVVDEKYAWETDWTKVPATELISVSQITGQLDSNQLNEFRISNVTVTLKNTHGQWSRKNNAGVFRRTRDTVIFTRGPYVQAEPFWTKFKVKAGWVLADGTLELADMFVGVGTKFQYTGHSDNVVVTVEGLENTLKNTNAGSLYTTGYELKTGDGVTKVFTTTTTGIKRITRVFFGTPGPAGPKTEGIDYTVEQLGEYSLGAKITFVSTPVNTQQIYIYYEVWQKDKTVESLVKSLLTSAGIASANQKVSNVIFPGGVVSTMMNEEKTEWDAGTVGEFDTSRSIGDLFFDSGHRSWCALEDSFANLNAWTHLDVTIASGKVELGGYMYKPSTKVCGCWKFDIEMPSAGAPATEQFNFAFMSKNAPTATSTMKEGYVLWGSMSTSYPGRIDVYLSRVQSDGYIPTLGYSGPLLATAGTMQTLEVTRNSAGRIRVYFAGTLVIDVTDTNYTTSNYVGFFGGDPLLSLARIDNYYGPTTAAVATYISRSMNTAGATSWGRILMEKYLDGATLQIYTRSSPDGATWSSWLLLGAADDVLSPVDDYLQFKLVLTVGDINTTDSYFKYANVEYTTSLTTIAIANFSTISVFDAIQSLGKFGNFEWGFDASENFIFRAKSESADPQEFLMRGKNLLDISNLSEETDRLYSGVKVKYGDAAVEIKESDSGDWHSIKKTYGEKIFEVDGGTILASHDANVANGIAAIYAKYLIKLRRRAQVKTKLMDWIELGDVVQVDWKDTHARPLWFHGDPDRYLGETTIYHYSRHSSTGDQMVARVLGFRHDMENKISDLELEEVVP